MSRGSRDTCAAVRLYRSISRYLSLSVSGRSFTGGDAGGGVNRLGRLTCSGGMKIRAMGPTGSGNLSASGGSSVVGMAVSLRWRARKSCQKLICPPLTAAEPVHVGRARRCGRVGEDVRQHVADSLMVGVAAFPPGHARGMGAGQRAQTWRGLDVHVALADRPAALG